MELPCPTCPACPISLRTSKTFQTLGQGICSSTGLHSSGYEEYPAYDIYFFLISRRKHILWVLIRSASVRKIYCGYSLEVPQWGTSNENPQYMFSLRNKKKCQFLGKLILVREVDFDHLLSINSSNQAKYYCCSNNMIKCARITTTFTLLTSTTLSANSADDKVKIFFLFVLEHRLWHFMQNTSWQFARNVKAYFLAGRKKEEKYHQFVIFGICP